MAPYRNPGQSSGFEPYDMNQQPISRDGNAAGKSTAPDSLTPELLLKIQSQTRTIMDVAPASANLPAGPHKLKMQAFEKELYSLCKTANDHATFALEHKHTNTKQTDKKVRDACSELKKFTARVDKDPTLSLGQQFTHGDATPTPTDSLESARKALLEETKAELSTLMEKFAVVENHENDPIKSRLNEFAEESHALTKGWIDAATYAATHQGDDGREARQTMDELPAKLLDIQARVKLFESELPKPTMWGYVKYRLGMLTWARTRTWMWARNFSVLSVAVSLLCRAYAKGGWTDLLLAFTLVMNA